MDEFERAANEVDKNINSDHENVIEWMRNSPTATVTLSQGKYITKVKKMAKEHPDQVQILHEYNDHIVAHIPTKSIKLSIIQGHEYTEEEKQKLRKQLQKVRNKQ